MTEATTFAEVIETVREQSSHLLGTTISFGEDDWAAPTHLQGWTRSHVAAHLVDNALGLAAVIARLADGSTTLHTGSTDARHIVELRALHAGIDLQIELDETAGFLQAQLPKVEHVVGQVYLSEGWSIAAHDLPVLRLREIVIHHFDLIGEDALQLRTPMWIELLGFEVQRPEHASLPPVLLVSDEGFSCRLGTGDEATTIMGPARDLFAWLARRVQSPNVSGVEHLDS